MAVNTVSIINDDTWTLIQTNATTTGATSTFSNLSGFKEYILNFKLVSLTAGNINIKFNSITTGYFGGTERVNGYECGGSTSGVYVTVSDYLSNFTGIVNIKNAKNGAPKFLTGVMSPPGNTNIHRAIGGNTATDEITSLIITAGTGSFSNGSIELYGIVG